MASLNKTIESLTKDQFEIIQWLRGHQRASISGCAGSGKTLVAAEKAIRLDRAGFRTLILCHNPRLASHLEQLTSGTGIRVFDFVFWIAHLLGESRETHRGWTRYEEPTEQELNDAFDALADSTKKYDAVIVDEGQDFREEWWLVVEKALLSPQYGILYIFFDDNQSLLPLRSKYPVENAPFNLSKNCRNAGQIFEVVRRFHPQAPEPSVFLAQKGIYRQTVFLPGDELRAINDALHDALRFLAPTQIAILTTEPDPAESSVLNGLIVEHGKQRWQDVVYKFLGRKNLKLSEMPIPTEEDINAVVEIARAHKIKGFEKKLIEEYRWRYYVRWQTSAHGIELYTIPSFDRDALLWAFFSSFHWSSSIPILAGVKISVEKARGTDRSTAQIPLYTVASFKGLEADAVILFVRALQDELGASLYVGLSRAKFIMHLVIDAPTFHRLPPLQNDERGV